MQCYVPTCTNSSNKCQLENINISFHQVPIDEQKRHEWLKATGLINIIPKNCIFHVCSEHFTPDDYFQIPNSDNERILKYTAVPTIIEKPLNMKTKCGAQIRKIKSEKTDSDDVPSSDSESLSGLNDLNDCSSSDSFMNDPQFSSLKIPPFGPEPMLKITIKNAVEKIDAMDFSSYDEFRKNEKISVLQKALTREKHQLYKLRNANKQNLKRLNEYQMIIYNYNSKMAKRKRYKGDIIQQCVKENISKLQEPIVKNIAEKMFARSTRTQNAGNVSYTQEVKRFATQLYQISPSAYKYVKNSLNNCLPLPRIDDGDDDDYEDDNYDEDDFEDIDDSDSSDI